MYVIKRPGVDQFMKRVGELYEVVVFTASVSKVSQSRFLWRAMLSFLKYGDPLLDQLDIHKVVHHRLFRESCYNHQGNYVKVSNAFSPQRKTLTRVHRIYPKSVATCGKQSSSTTRLPRTSSTRSTPCRSVAGFPTPMTTNCST